MKELFLTALAVIATSPALATESVLERAEADQTWGATYRGLVQELGSLWNGGIRDDLANQTGLDPADLGIALRYLRDYPVNDLRVKWVLIRYAHYSGEAVTRDFQRLEALAILATEDGKSWRITAKGNAVIRAWYTIAAQHAALYEKATEAASRDALVVLNKIVAKAASLDTGDINQSIRWRLNHAYRVASDAPSLLKIDERVWDYVAFINDNAHYRVNRYLRIGGVDSRYIPKLSPLSKELFAATRSGREYPLERCATHRVWRVSEATCNSAFKELIEMGWIGETSKGAYSQTRDGDLLFRKIESLTDRRLYSTWADVTGPEYSRFKAVLDAMPASIEKIRQDIR